MEAMLQKVLLALVSVAVIKRTASAEKITVGGDQGWDATVNYDKWVTSQNFKTGDQLVFTYNAGLHSVVELKDETAYKSCDIRSPLNTMSTGKDEVKLGKDGTRYFTCRTAGHCSQGMKLKVTVGSSSTSPSSSPAGGSSSSASSSSTASSSPAANVSLASALGSGSSSFLVAAVSSAMFLIYYVL